MLALFVIILMAPICWLVWPRHPAYAVVIHHTNVLSASISMTSGTSHTYRHRPSWRHHLGNGLRNLGFPWLGDLLAGTPLRSSPDGNTIKMYTMQPSDVLWLTCTHRTMPGTTAAPFLRLEDDRGGKRLIGVTGVAKDTGKCQTIRPLSVPGGLAANRGSVLHVEDLRRGTNVVEVHLLP